MSLFFTVKKESFLVSLGRKQVGVDGCPPREGSRVGVRRTFSWFQGTFSYMFREGSRDSSREPPPYQGS